MLYSGVTGYYFWRCSAKHIQKEVPKQVRIRATPDKLATRTLGRVHACALVRGARQGSQARRHVQTSRAPAPPPSSTLHSPSSLLQVYAWFMVVFRLSVGAGFCGYILLLLEFTGLGLLLRPLLGPGAALTGGAGSRGEAEGGWRVCWRAQGFGAGGHAAACRNLGCAASCRSPPPCACIHRLRLQPSHAPAPASPCFLPAAVWYGLYYGILTRDSAEVASDRIARSLGTGRKMAVSVRVLVVNLWGRWQLDGAAVRSMGGSSEHGQQQWVDELPCEQGRRPVGYCTAQLTAPPCSVVAACAGAQLRNMRRRAGR